MTEKNIVNCFNEILKESEDITDSIFIIFYIFDTCKNLSNYDAEKMQRVAHKINLETNFTKSSKHFATLRGSFFETLRAHITPRQNKQLANTVKIFC